jgi:S1-C subfamily serine protease
MIRDPRLVLAFVLASLLAGCGGGAHKGVGGPPATTVPLAHPKALGFTQLVARVRTGIVRIETSTCAGEFVGTGFLLTPRLIATVEHVVDGAFVITLKQNGRIVGTGTVVGEDTARDVALVESSRPIRGYRFKITARSPQLGEDVAAIGFPLGLPLTVTRGSISGLDRTIPIGGIERRKLVQTDAPVNPGNSGGPLMTDAGQVVGLIDLGTTQANGLAFAVSGAVAAPLLAAWGSALQPVGAPSCQSQPQAAAPPTSTTTAAQPSSYTGQDFTIDYPVGWLVSHISEGRNLDTTFTSSSNSAFVLRVDENPHAGSLSVDAAAAPVIAALRRQSTYQELAVNHVSFEGMDAVKWEFEDTEGGVRLHKVDLFFIDTSGHGWGILTQAPASVWSQVSSAFDSYVQTFQSLG